MMMSNGLKKVAIGQLVSTIKLERDMHEVEGRSKHEVKAIALLLGGYNQFGRHIDHKKYMEVIRAFDQVLYDMKKLLGEVAS